MKCPYRRIVSQKIDGNRTITSTDFAECEESECPFYTGYHGYGNGYKSCLKIMSDYKEVKS